jgi:hypothetical protein
MMGPIVCGVKFFLDVPPKMRGAECARSRSGLLNILQAIMAINFDWIACYPNTPSLYACDGRDELHPLVVYKPRLQAPETFACIPEIMAEGSWDCDGLAAWRVAELRHCGINASVYIKWRQRGSPDANIYHAVVRWPDGRIEDPSLALGMGGVPITRKSVWIDPGPMPEADERIPLL